MSSQFVPTESRILLTAVQEMDQLSRRFRRRLRDVAVGLSREAGQSVPIGPDTIAKALPLVCRELLLDAASSFGDERGSDGPKEEAA